MNHSDSGDPLANASREEIMSALFANMVVQQTNLAMMMLGRVAHPETGQFIQDVETARMFIDQLEMLEVKTKGNLTKEEEGLLKQGLTALRMAFVEAVESPAAGQPRPSAGGSAPAPPPGPAEPKTQPPPAPAASTAEEESRKKFSKKY
jgi:uncharacterized protein DUF1844